MHRIYKTILVGLVGFCLFVFMLETAIAATGSLTQDGFLFDYETKKEQIKIDPNLDASDNGSVAQTPGTNTITIKATSSTKQVVNLWITKLTYYAANYKNTLTITNNTGKVLKISYTAAGMDSGNGNFSDVVVQPGGKLIFSVTSNETNKDSGTSKSKSGTFTITKIEEVAGIQVSFASSSHGSYSYTLGSSSATVEKGAAISQKFSASVGSAVSLTAGNADENYTFYGWMASGNLLGKENAEYTLQEDAVIYPVFLPNDVIAKGEPFKVGSNYYMFWNDAFSDALSSKNTVVLTGEYALSNVLETNGLCEGFSSAKCIYLENGELQFVVPFGTTFLVPFDDGHTLYTTTPAYAESYTKPSYYFTFTMNSDTNIHVKGDMSLSGKHCSNMGQNGAPVGELSHLQMSEGSSVIVEEGGSLYAWGYITGEGTISVESGGSVYEDFQITDWRGGSATKSMNDNSQRVFPVSQYYIQNIEVPLVLNAGAREFVCMTVEVSKMTRTVLVPFVGGAGDAVMFRIKSGSMTKYYEGETDRQHFEIDGAVELYYFSVTIPGVVGVGDTTLNTANYYMPLNGNITVTVKENASISIANDLVLLPGVEINIDYNANCVVTDGCRVVVYDADQWGTYCYDNAFIKPVKYAPGQTCATRSAKSAADLSDAQIIVNGTLDSSNGALYVTSGGSNICSTGEGKVIVGAAGTKPKYYQATQSGTTISYSEISIEHAKLKNEKDGSYVDTSSVTEKTTYTHAHYICECDAAKGTDANGNPINEFTHGTWATAHTPTSTTVDPTCTDRGYTTFTCSCRTEACEGAYKAALGHSWSNWDEASNVFTTTCEHGCNQTIKLTLEYRVSDYVWLNAFVQGPAEMTLTTNTFGYTLQPLNGDYYLVRKINAKELPIKFTVQFTALGADTPSGDNALEISFAKYRSIKEAEYDAKEAGGLTDEEQAKITAYRDLFAAMDAYGKAAQTYFGGKDADPAAKPEDMKNHSSSTLDSVSNSKGTLNGVYIATKGVNFSFDECITMTMSFALNSGKTMSDLGTITQVGLLVGDSTTGKLLTTNEGDYSAAYLLYSLAGLSGPDGSVPGAPTYKPGNHSTITLAELQNANTWNISFDLASAELYTKYALRLFIVVDNTPDNATDDDFSVLYGTQYHYGLADYLVRTYGKEPPEGYKGNAYNNLMIATWNYMVAADAAFNGVKQ